MASRSLSQKIGSKGHKWLMSKIEDHEHWLARCLDEDFGIDAEAELTEDGPLGHILKLQFKATESVQKRRSQVRVTIEKKYIDYAKSCRYPLIFVLVDLGNREAWYMWLQKWILEEQAAGERLENQESYTRWISLSATIQSGLSGEWKDIAKWRNETQLMLSLLDALKVATATYNEKLISHFIELLRDISPSIANTSLDILIGETIFLGERMRGTFEGLTISKLLFPLIREFGGQLSKHSVIGMVQRSDSYSRTGLIGLGILYDEYFAHTTFLKLPSYFVEQELPGVAYYCALRENFPAKKSLDFVFGPGDFIYANLKFVSPESESFVNKYANRGPSAILDYLEFIPGVEM